MLAKWRITHHLIEGGVKMNKCQKVTKCCGTCDNMYMGSNEPVDDDTVCYCGIDNHYLCYPDERMQEDACKEWIPNDEAKERVKIMSEYVEVICQHILKLKKADGGGNTELDETVDACVAMIKNRFMMENATLCGSIEGHTRYLQGLDLPIYINSIQQTNGITMASDVSEMHVGKYDDADALLITPSLVAVPNEDEFESSSRTIADLIHEAVQRELRFETDNLTAEGFTFVENEAPVLVMKKILIDILPTQNDVDKHASDIMHLSDYFSISSDEVDEVTVASYLQAVISEHVAAKGAIRVYT